MRVLSRPALKLLTNEAIEKIIGEAMSILAKIGVLVENDDGLNLLKEAGMRVKLSQKRVYITEELVSDCLKTVPSSIKVYDRDGDETLKLGGDNVYFVPGSSALFFLDSNGKIRRPDTKTYINFITLTDCLPYIKGQSTALIPSDVPEDIADRYRLYLSLIYGRKPVVTGTFKKDSFAPMLKMLISVRGNETELRKKPLAIFDVCPSSPLKWSDLTCQCLIDCVRHGIPSEFVSMPLAGATAPVTLYGSIVQHTAENLSGVVISQLASPGSSVIYGGSPAIFDMRYGTTPMGAVETMMIDCAYNQIGKYLGMPTHAYMGLSDSKALDTQTGFESGISTILASLSGINVVAGAGMLNFENCQSLEKLVIDNEICGMAYRLLEGVKERDEVKTEAVLHKCLKKSSFLSHPTTLEWFKEEQFIPTDIIDRMDKETWEKRGRKLSLNRAKEKVKKILHTCRPNRIDKDKEKELKKIIRSTSFIKTILPKRR